MTAAHEIETEDVAVAALKFNCGAIGTLTATTAAFPGLPARLDLFGTEGCAIIEGDRLKKMELKSGEVITGESAAHDAISVAQGGTASVKDDAAKRALFGDKKAGWGDAHRAQLLDFIHAIRDDTQPLVDGTAARKAVEIVLSVYRSVQTSMPVPVDEVARETRAARQSMSVSISPFTAAPRRPEVTNA
jgi:predicted dehydrogenase